MANRAPLSIGYSVFAIDPGETTGWAWACVARSELDSLGVAGALAKARSHRSGTQAADTRFRYGQIGLGFGGSPLLKSGLPDMALAECIAVDQILTEALVCQSMGSRTSFRKVPRLTSIVVEDFILRERTQSRNLLAPVRLTAKLEQQVYLSRDLRHVPFSTSQSASSAKGVVTDKRLREWGLWIRGQQHARDAIRHLVLHLRGIS